MTGLTRELWLYRGMWLSAAASLVFAVGCGSPSNTDGGTGCTSDATCGTGKVCHPVLKACVASCTGAVDCPAAEKTCAKFDGTAGTSASPGFCQCSTNELCNTSTAGNICSTALKQCAGKCTATSCPSGYSCNTASGQCTGGGGNVDAGTDAGVACSTNNPQPDTCGYGHACNDVMSCQEAANDTSCANVAAASLPTWNHDSATGPVIYVATDDADVNAGCTDANTVAFTTTLYGYAGPTYTFPATISAATQVVYITSTGAKNPINGVLVGSQTNAWSHYIVSNNGKNVEIKLTLCAPAGTTALTAGFAFTNGNAICVALTRN